MKAKNSTDAFNPANGELIGSVEHTPLEQLPQVFAQARQAQTLWAQRSFKQRRKHILLMRSYIRDHADELAAVVSESNGKTITDALITEVLPCVLACSWYGKNAAKVLKTERREMSSMAWLGKRSQIRHEPLGVVGIISPWNYPLSIPFGEVVMALMAGNAVVLKVAAATPLVGQAIEKIVATAGLPDGLFSHVVGSGGKISSAMFDHGVDKLFFTGSVPTGKQLMAQAAETLTPVSLELGGKDAMIVLADADLERAANGAAWAGLQNAGQSCGAVERIYVDASVYDDFVALLSKKVNAMRHGACNGGFAVEMGAMTTAKQNQTVAHQVEEAVKAGAKIVAQTQAHNADAGEFHPGLVMVDVDHTMPLMREETFGPVLPVMPFSSVDEAVALANDCSMALTASIWSRNLRVAKALADRVDGGVVTINEHLYTHGMSDLPWGGPKESGIGRTHGPEGLLEMTKEKAVNWDILRGKRNMWWYPHDQQSYERIKSAIELVAPRSLTGLLKALIQVMPFMLGKTYRK